jgi:7-cyano-7-deazaguanine synthase
VATYYDVSHKVFDIKQFLAYSNCSLLTRSTKEVKEGSYDEQLKAKKKDDILETYVPFRNSLLLSIAATIRISVAEDDKVYIYLKNHVDDAAGNAYTDCSMQFVTAIGNAIKLGTYNKVEIKSPFVNFNKAQIVEKGLSLGVPYELTWSCYKGGEKPCGKCGTCIDRINTFKINGLNDLTMKE